MKKKIILFLLVFCSVFGLTGMSENINPNTVAFAVETRKVFLGGTPAGFVIQTRGAFVAGLTDVITETGIKSPSKSAGICQGDIIYYINNVEVNCASDIEKAIKTADGSVEIEYYRCGNTYTAFIEPATDLVGIKKLGIFVRDDVSGIGTVTFIEGNRIATLGHPVLGENDSLLEVKGGKIYGCNVTGYIKGERGNPGELRGVILKNEEMASIEKNTLYGIYGTTVENFNTADMTEIEVGEGKMGDAYIYTTINGKEPEKYTVSIVKADNLLSDTKNYVIKITDKRLLETTGGIVQGMSGSPIVQNGKLIGAVTHVFISDPTRGFGISINNMLNK